MFVHTIAQTGILLYWL